MLGAHDVRAQIAELRRRSADALRRAERAAASAARSEQQAELVPESLRETCLRAVALQRSVQARHLISARLQDQYADRLSAWLDFAVEPGRQPGFMDAVVATIGMQSATVILNTRRGQAVVAASSPTAGAANNLEFVLGEGPTHSAIAHGQPVQVTDMAQCDRWPRYGPEVVRLGVRAVLAVPVQPAPLGAVCAYNSEPAIRQEAVAAADAIADALPVILPHASLGRADEGSLPALPLFGEADFPATVHQAAGMVSIHCGCGITDALALLRARAFSVGRPAEEIAAWVLRGELRLC